MLLIFNKIIYISFLIRCLCGLSFICPFVFVVFLIVDNCKKAAHSALTRPEKT